MYKVIYCYSNVHTESENLLYFKYDTLEQAEKNFKYLLDTYIKINKLNKDSFRDLSGNSYDEIFTKQYRNTLLPLYKDNRKDAYICLEVDYDRHSGNIEGYVAEELMKMEE